MAVEFGSVDFGDFFDEVLPFVTPEEVLQYIPASLLAPTSPDLTYQYGLFENLSGTQSSQEIKTTLNSFLPYHEPAPPNFSPQIISPVNDAARPCTIYSFPTPLSPPTPTPSQNAMSCLPTWRKIPQTAYGQGKKQWDFRPSEPILFHVDGRPGVNMGDALRNVFAGLDGRDDPMFQDAGDAFSCRLLFPGYPLNSKPQIFTKRWNKDHNPITRSALAYNIARKLKSYLDLMASSHSLGGSIDKQWEIGEGFMTLDNMFLVRLEHVTKGSYQPEIWVTDNTV